jgi:hypothetical protein
MTMPATASAAGASLKTTLTSLTTGRRLIAGRLGGKSTELLFHFGVTAFFAGDFGICPHQQLEFTPAFLTNILVNRHVYPLLGRSSLLSQD